MHHPAKLKIAPSILAADLSKLGEEARAVIAAGADRLHFDVMDFHYVPNLTMGPQVLSAIRKSDVHIPIDVHLMVQHVEACIPAFVEAGAASLIVHPETTIHLDRTLKRIKSLGVQVGIALNPADHLGILDYIWPLLDQILVMTVNPGFVGQAFIPEMLTKIKTIRETINKNNYAIDLMVDGGVSLQNCKQVFQAGANILVFGNGIYQTKDYTQTISQIREFCSA
ncbi:MAG: ribulose-phosphate 3-epimerase [Gammaproteobacteria bacterium]